MRDLIAQVQISSLLFVTLVFCGPLDPATAQGPGTSNLSAGTSGREPPEPATPPELTTAATPRACARPLNVPAALAVPAGNRLHAAYFAQGVQIYTCQSQTTSGYAWTLKAPDAHLLDLRGEVQAIHYAGPTWESTVDGSKVVGAVVARANSAEAGAVPWLLLRADSTSGRGLFGQVTFIQRLSTAAGAAPITGCEAATVGAELRVPYSTIYYFYATGQETHCR